MNKYSLDQCEQEKLHLSGAIQSHGTLLVVNSQNIITHVAKNITGFQADIAEKAKWNKFEMSEKQTWCVAYSFIK